MDKRQNLKDPDAAKPHDEVEPRSLKGNLSRFALPLTAILCLAVALPLYILRLDNIVGMFVDDAWYVLLAKAIATGHGYTLINSPSPGIPPLYPPAFPALLSLVFRFAPEFPQNLWLLKSVSIIAMMGVGVVTFWYFRTGRGVPGHLALALAMATTITPPFVFLATSTLMSEPVYILSLMLTVAIIEYAVRSVDGRKVWRYALLASFVASFSFLTRSVAIALIGSVILYLLKLRQWFAALVFAIGIVVCTGPWLVYSRAHTPTGQQIAEQRGYIVTPYTTQFWQHKAGHARSGGNTLSDLPERVWDNVSQMFTRDAGEILLAKIHYVLDAAGPGAKVLSVFLALIVIAGYISAVRERITLAEIVVPSSLAIVLIWPWETFRFVLPLTPFALYYMLLGLRSIFYAHLRLRQEARRPVWTGMTVIAVFVVAIHVYGNVSYLQLLYSDNASDRPGLMRAFEENVEVLRWMQQRVPAKSVVACTNPGLVHLYTGLKTVASDDPQQNFANWNRIGVRYLAYISAMRMKEPDLAESRYTVVHKSRGDLNLRVVDLGPPESREYWGLARPQIIN